MDKQRLIGPGDGDTGPDGLEVRLLLNDLIPGKTYITPLSFVWTGSLAAYAGLTLLVNNDYDLAGGNITLPAGCDLVFDGGSLLNVGTLTGNRSRVFNKQQKQIFSTTMSFAGTWIGGRITPQCFGAVCSVNSTILEAGGAIDSRAAIQKVLDYPF